ncbi:MAG: signal recognition particle-docking protein FtsY [Coriobacteriia bacterium]|jgi:fused signal recognition particle receptor|nr:signal recognition particle-docking protein FtsY [Coriobacteriia bacterium]
MVTPWYKRVSEGLSRSRERLGGQLNVLLRKGPNLDQEFWDDLEDALIGADVGATAVADIVDRLRDTATRNALPDAQAVLDHLAAELVREFPVDAADPLKEPGAVIIVVGVNGTGKTTTVGKLATEAVREGRSVLLGSGDTYRAAAVEQLDIWAERAGVPVVRRERGADPAAVAFDTVTQANESHPDLTLIDTAGRLHTSPDLMRELEKIVRIARRESVSAVRCVLVLDATTGQNGLAQAREFHAALDLDAIILTKLDGTAKGGIAVAIARELGLPIVRVGVGEGADDLKPFVPEEFARALTDQD